MICVGDDVFAFGVSTTAQSVSKARHREAEDLQWTAPRSTNIARDSSDKFRHERAGPITFGNKSRKVVPVILHGFHSAANRRSWSTFPFLRWQKPLRWCRLCYRSWSIPRCRTTNVMLSIRCMGASPRRQVLPGESSRSCGFTDFVCTCRLRESSARSEHQSFWREGRSFSCQGRLRAESIIACLSMF